MIRKRALHINIFRTNFLGGESSYPRMLGLDKSYAYLRMLLVRAPQRTP